MFNSIFKSYKINRFSQQHLKTAIRLSQKLCNKIFPSQEEKQKVEHLIYCHLNAARRAYKLKKKKRKK